MRLHYFVLAVAILALPDASFAATAYGGACAPASAQVDAEKATSFLDSPPAFLANFADGGGALSSAIRDLVTIRPETLEGIQSLAGAATPEQNRAIGAGLGTAAAICVVSQPATAMDIQAAALKSNNEELLTSFASITGDIPSNAIAGSDPTGESTAGGGRGGTPVQQAGGGSASAGDNTPSFAAARTSVNNVLSAVAAAPAVVVSPVSPTN
jgi:hypothetical protein